MYGIHADEENDKYMETVDIALDAFAQGMVPGKFLVEFFPFLRHVPVWFPWARSQRLWAKWQDAGRRLKDAPFTYTDQNVARPSLIRKDGADSSSRFRKGKKMLVNLSSESFLKKLTMSHPTPSRKK